MSNQIANDCSTEQTLGGVDAPLPTILFVSLRGPSNAARRGGAQEYIHRIAAPWIDKGMHVEILCRQERDPGGNGWLPEQETIDGIRIVRVGRGWSGLWQLLREVRRRSQSAACVIENLMTVPLLTPLLTQAGKQRFAIKHHFLTRDMIRTMPWYKALILGFFENIVLPLVYRHTPLVVNSKSTGNEATRRWKRWGGVADVHIVPCGFQHIETREEQTSYPSVFFVGHINVMRKRVDHLIEAFLIATEDMPSARLTVGGDGPDLKHLMEQYAGNRSGKIEFLGFLGEEEKQQHYARAWLFASPSLAEGFGITWVEAGAHGTPLLGYDLDLDTVNESCSVLVPPGDVDELAKAMSRLLRDQSLVEQMGEAAKQNSKRFSWHTSSMRLLELMQARAREASVAG